jgi:hypothetical protein
VLLGRANLPITLANVCAVLRSESCRPHLPLTVEFIEIAGKSVTVDKNLVPSPNPLATCCKTFATVRESFARNR